MGVEQEPTGMSKPILDGIRVLDFGRYIAGPFCAALLADHGADVIRVERPEGNDDRFLMPVAGADSGAMYLQMNRNKRSLNIDVTRPDQRQMLEALVKTSDVVVVNLPPRALEKVGLDYAALKVIRPDIILTTITAFGSEGDFANDIGFDGTGQALSGAIHLSGTPGQPFRSAASFVDYSTGLSAAYGTMTALFHRQRTGEGQHVEASLLGSALTMTNPMLIEEATGTRSRVAVGNRSPISGPSDVFRTKDGWIYIQVVGQALFERWMTIVGAEDLKADPRFATDIDRGENGEVLSERMQIWCAQRTTNECLAELAAGRVPVYRVLSPSEALKASENETFLQWIDGPCGIGRIPVVKPPARLRGNGVAYRPAPLLGEHTDAILDELGMRAADPAGAHRDIE
jgi:crotonobetainyl-CoA:carnitine CoA-transferase CaiB-like acyl-CoA transferase